MLGKFRSAAENEFSSITTRHRLKSGEARDVELYIGSVDFEERHYLHTIVFDVTQRRIAEERMIASLDEKNHLIKEVYHRVKNNQQLVVSLLRMQADAEETAGTRKALQNAQDRMYAMSIVHDLVYQMEDLSIVNTPLFCRAAYPELRHQLRRAHAAGRNSDGSRAAGT